MIQKKRRIRYVKNCQFCKEGKQPGYEDVVTLSRYLSDRGRILGRERTGVCAKHQRRLAQEIKRSRHLALLPFEAGI